MPMKVTAFVSHPDCALHDTGWKHPEHQGRLPALVRAVYRDMLTLHDRLLEVEARPATEEDLLLVHTPAYVTRVREAVARADAAGEPLTLEGEMKVSAASWASALAAVGSAITGAEVVLAGEVRNAFCAARPPGEGALPEHAGRFSLFNNVAIAARRLRRQGVPRVLIVHWGSPDDALAQIFADDAGVRVLAVHQQSPAGGESAASPAPMPGSHSVTLPAGTGGGLFTSAFEVALDATLGEFTPELILLAAGFDALAADPLGDLALAPIDFYGLTEQLRERADALCGGRLVSVLEGGYAPGALGEAVVQHLRALSGLPPA